MNIRLTLPTFYRARDISDYIHDLYNEYKLDSVYTIYTRINSVIDIKPVITKLIPISSEDLLDGVNLDAYKKILPDPSTINMDYIPSPNLVMDYLAKTYLNGMVYGALTEAFASEQTTRMTAMKNATDNAEDILEKLTLISNRARQGRITEEIHRSGEWCGITQQTGSRLCLVMEEQNGNRKSNTNYRVGYRYPV